MKSQKTSGIETLDDEAVVYSPGINLKPSKQGAGRKTFNVLRGGKGLGSAKNDNPAQTSIRGDGSRRTENYALTESTKNREINDANTKKK